MENKVEVIEAGITIEGDNKWLTLMKTALWYQKAQVDK